MEISLEEKQKRQDLLQAFMLKRQGKPLTRNQVDLLNEDARFDLYPQFTKYPIKE